MICHCFLFADLLDKATPSDSVPLQHQQVSREFSSLYPILQTN